MCSHSKLLYCIVISNYTVIKQTSVAEISFGWGLTIEGSYWKWFRYLRNNLAEKMQWWNSKPWHPCAGTTVLPCVVIKWPSSTMNLNVWGFPCLLCRDRWSCALIGSRWQAISQVAPWKNIPAHKFNYKWAGFLTLVRVRPAADQTCMAQAFPR